MGAGQSTQFATAPSRALHVLRVTPDSPASKTTIEPLFDFVVGFEGDSLASQNNIDAVVLERIVEGHEGRTLNLLVWNTKSQETRVVPIVPSRAWSLPSTGSAQQDAAAQPSLLGLSMRICEPEFAMDNVWHVLDVLEGSPAESAGLVPYGDYITGWSGGVLGAENDFYELVEAHVDKPLRVYVYSHDFDALREVVLVPNRHWGGEGLLGCVFGYGLLHRIPPQPAERAATPPELHDNTDEYEETELFVPADIPTQPHYLPSQLADWQRQQEDEQPYRPTPVAPILEEEFNEHDRHDHDHDHEHEHAHHHTTPPGPPRRTSSLTGNSSLRSSRGTTVKS
ncbi:GRASP55/65 PDZ-like domain-containing protein [Mycena albidolilacea]|uniref:GRASP55/65 PDZ-like domain-containing protein n=1 Tax=Mycena albidolilacea TaxID=1033008 RepID=A0AAD7ARQ1_9AGAR|nr:GRASP55/65 PDZ-like domain-containing protein [Mycena albidolilacea]